MKTKILLLSLLLCSPLLGWGYDYTVNGDRLGDNVNGDYRSWEIDPGDVISFSLKSGHGLAGNPIVLKVTFAGAEFIAANSLLQTALLEPGPGFWVERTWTQFIRADLPETYLADFRAPENIVDWPITVETWEYVEPDGQVASYKKDKMYFFAIPEPATLSLLALGGLWALRRR